MTAKEKAKELYEKIYFLEVNKNGCWMFKDAAKQCALICIDEKIEALLPYAGLLDIKKQVQELEEVKQEVNKL